MCMACVVLSVAQVMKVVVTVVTLSIVGNGCCCGERGSQLGVRFRVCGPCMLLSVQVVRAS